MATKKKSEAPNSGTISEIKDRVGDDPEAAAAVLEAEQAEDDPRSTLIEDMTAIIEDAPEAVADDPAPASAAVTGDDEDGDDTVIAKEEVIAYGLMRHTDRIITTVAVSPGQRVSKARLEQIAENNAAVEAEAARRKAAAAKAREPEEPSEGE